MTAPEISPAFRMPRPAAAQPRLLHADDDPAILRLSDQVLTAAGFGVVTVDNGDDAWHRLRNGHFDLLITDHDMPRMCGLELIARVRGSGLELPIVLASGSLSACHMGRDWLTFHPLKKPFAAQDLIALVRRLLSPHNAAPAAPKPGDSCPVSPFIGMGGEFGSATTDFL